RVGAPRASAAPAAGAPTITGAAAVPPNGSSSALMRSESSSTEMPLSSSIHSSVVIAIVLVLLSCRALSALGVGRRVAARLGLAGRGLRVRGGLLIGRGLLRRGGLVGWSGLLRPGLRPCCGLLGRPALLHRRPLVARGARRGLPRRRC